MDDGTVRVQLHGELDVSRADDITGSMSQAMSAEGVRHVVIDLADVAFIDSTCLGSFIGAHSRASTAGVGLTLVNANHRVRRILEMTRLGAMFGVDDRPTG